MFGAPSCIVKTGASIRPLLPNLHVPLFAALDGDCRTCGAPWLYWPIERPEKVTIGFISAMQRCSYCRTPF